MQHFYTTKVHCQGSKAEYIMLRIVTASGELVRVRTGKKWSYINSIIKAANLKMHYCKDDRNICGECEAEDREIEQKHHDRMELLGRGMYYMHDANGD